MNKKKWIILAVIILSSICIYLFYLRHPIPIDSDTASTYFEHNESENNVPTDTIEYYVENCRDSLAKKFTINDFYIDNVNVLTIDFDEKLTEKDISFISYTLSSVYEKLGFHKEIANTAIISDLESKYSIVIYDEN